MNIQTGDLLLFNDENKYLLVLAIWRDNKVGLTWAKLASTDGNYAWDQPLEQLTGNYKKVS